MNFSLLLDFLENYSDFRIDHRYENTYYIIRKEANPPIVFINSNRISINMQMPQPELTKFQL
jgi:hypothetical protein